MARAKKPAAGKSGSKRPVESCDHQDKKRANNPPVGLVTPDTDPDTDGTKKLTANAMKGKDVLHMVKRRFKDVGLPEKLTCHAFRATTISHDPADVAGLLAKHGATGNGPQCVIRPRALRQWNGNIRVEEAQHRPLADRCRNPHDE